jgi:putative endonuclease
MAEDRAAAWLRGQGYRVIERNYRTHVGEIDAIATEGFVLCFIEVKARATMDYGSPLEAVTPHRMRRLGRAASLYLVESEWDGACRFDVLGMLAGPDGWEFELVRDAFWLGR